MALELKQSRRQRCTRGRAEPDCTSTWVPADSLDCTSESQGLAHSQSDVVGYFKAAGFRDVTVHEFIAGSLDRIVGRKA